MGFVVSFQIRDTQSPPLVEISRLAAENQNCINLGQGVPRYSPSNAYIDNVLRNPAVNRYAPDPGISELREAIVHKYAEDQAINLDVDEILITPGANQAFINVLLTALDRKSKVGLLTPYYFNHQMACTLLGYEPVEIPLSKDFSLNFTAIRNAIKAGVSLLVFVNPGNPTGINHSESEIAEILELLDEFQELQIISDETYEYFSYLGRHHSLAKFENYRDRIHVISSMSKSFGIPGWRVGWYVGTAEFIQESIKVQDTTVISAPMASQLYSVELITNRIDILPEFQKYCTQNYQTAFQIINEIEWLDNIPSSAAYYLFPKVRHEVDIEKMCYRMINEADVAAIPGHVFGLAYSKHLRISFANVSEEDLIDGLHRLDRFGRDLISG